jgi:hypothetical protein
VRSFRLGALAALGTLRGLEGALPLVLGLLLCALTAWLERFFHPVHAVDRALIRDSFGVWLPLSAYAVVRRASAGGRLDSLVRAIVHHAGNRRQALAGASLMLGGILVVSGACFAVATVLAAHPTSEAGLARDLLLSGWVGALAGASYAAWLVFASQFGKRGRRGTLLALDLILGSSLGVWALPFPRAHVRNLLGGAPPLALPQSTSSALLMGSIVLLLAITWLRTAD